MSTPDNALPELEPVLIDDCWNRIGVHGDGSCPLLAEHVHCRNCPVYSAAAIRVLDRERPLDAAAGTLDQISRMFASDKLQARRGALSAFIFRVGNEWLALPTVVLEEVAELRAIHSLPHRRSGVVLGLANVRGELLVCLSLAQLLGIDSSSRAVPASGARATQQRLLVVNNQAGRLVLPVDEVHGTHRYDDSDARPVPTTVAKASATYSRSLLAWRDHAVGLLDADLLFHSLERNLA